MIILITGGSKCGKSLIAEEILRNIRHDKYYIATMEPYGEEAERAIAIHRRLREGKNFLTIECRRNIGELAFPIGSSVLLECIPTLTANEMFGGDSQYPADRVVGDIVEAAKPTGLFVAVTNDVGSDGVTYTPETAEYVRVLGDINRRLADIADTVIEAVYGIPVLLKGEMP